MTSERAMNQLEKWLRWAWYSTDSSGMPGSSFSMLLRLDARAISRPSGSRKMKSPKPRYCMKKLWISVPSAGEFLLMNTAGIWLAFARLASSELRLSRGRSGFSARIIDSRANPALSSIAPPRGKRTSENTPSRYG